ncbi:MAG: hypothetical protein ACE5EX_01205 [Phycisphaerae bacterium]
MNRYLRKSLVAVLALSVPAGTAWCQEHGRTGDEGQRGRRGMRQRMMRDDGAPKAGEMAPAFALKSLDGKSEMSLERFRGKKPVVLFFGSYT